MPTRPFSVGSMRTTSQRQRIFIYIARLIDLLWECDDEFDLAANFEIGLSKEVEPSVTDIPGVRVQFVSLGFSWQNPHGETHRESPRLAAFRSVTHRYPLGLGIRRNANIGSGKLQCENQRFLS